VDHPGRRCGKFRKHETRCVRGVRAGRVIRDGAATGISVGGHTMYQDCAALNRPNGSLNGRAFVVEDWG
jgi:hypothetical protein